MREVFGVMPSDVSSCTPTTAPAALMTTNGTNSAGAKVRGCDTTVRQV